MTQVQNPKKSNLELDYYQLPENYGGSNLQNIRKLFIATEKSIKTDGDDDKNKKDRSSPMYKFFKRYRHIIPPMEGEIMESDSDDDDVYLDDGSDLYQHDRTGGILSLQVPLIQTLVAEKKPSTAAIERSDSPGPIHVIVQRTSSEQLAERGSSLSLREESPPQQTPSRDMFEPKVQLLAGSIMEEVNEDSGEDKSLSSMLGTSQFSSDSLSPVRQPPTSPSAVVFGRRGTSTTVRSKMMTTHDVRARTAKTRFIGFVRKVTIAQMLVDSLVKKDAAAPVDASMLTFTDLIKDYTYDNLKNSGLSFDPSYYKAKKDTIIISTEVKNILCLPSSARSPEQVQTAMYGLQCLRSFAEYPLHMQEKLSKVAWYAVVPPKRVIIRQGHLAENFYFILSGQAVVTILVKDPKSGATVIRTATIMRKGMSFGFPISTKTSSSVSGDLPPSQDEAITGPSSVTPAPSEADREDDEVSIAFTRDDSQKTSNSRASKTAPIAACENPMVQKELALLHHSRRTATVTTQDTVQLLTIGRDDFFDIFMAGSGPDQLPEHIRYVSQLDFMKHWPIEKFVEHPEHCLLHFYKRNVVIVKDSRFSEWLYIVKSGTCHVIKQLRGVVPQLGLRRKSRGSGDAGGVNSLSAEAKVDTGLRRRRTSKSPHFTRMMTKDDIFCTKKHREKNKKRQDKHSSLCRRWRMKSMKPEPPPVTDTKPGPVFVQVEFLKPRDVFGLSSLQFEDDVETNSVSLVSRGAECIMVSKEYFAKQCSNQVRNNLRALVREYPDDVTFQSNLEIRADWELYKTTLIEDITSLNAAEKKLHQFRPT